MVTIRFTCEDNRELLEKGHRIIILNCPVIITPRQWTYGIPDWILPTLDREGVPYERIYHDDKEAAPGA